MLPSENIQSIVGATLYGPSHEKIGKIEQVFVDGNDGHPTWVSVPVGTVARHSAFVPLDEATWEDDTVTVPHSKERVKRSPRIDTDHGLEPAQEQGLRDYYAGSPIAADDARDPEPRHDEREHSADRAHIPDEPGVDDQGVLWEERLVVHKEKVPVAKVHLEKTTVTENREVTADVQKERVVLEEEQIPPRAEQ